MSGQGREAGSGERWCDTLYRRGEEQLWEAAQTHKSLGGPTLKNWSLLWSTFVVHFLKSKLLIEEKEREREKETNNHPQK